MPTLSLSALTALATKAIETAKTSPTSQTLAQHRLHYLFKGLGYLPDPVITKLNLYLKAASAEQYPHADAHLRLIMAINSKLKKPLTVDRMLKAREKFATDVVSIQAPDVWQQAGASDIESEVSWQDKTIVNGDGGDMTIRCYRDGKQQGHNLSNDEVVMLFFHGGGFCIGDIDTHHEFCHTVCAQTGWAVVSVDYRLAPEHRAPTALKDCMAAYAWLAENAQTFGASAARIVLSGDSAGGNLAILVAQQITTPTPALWQEINQDEASYKSFAALINDLPHPLAQMPIYPVTDSVGPKHPSWGLYGQGLLLDNAEADAFNSAYAKQSDLAQENPLVSVVHGDNSRICPSYIIAAELDILRDEALAYAERLKDEKANVQVYTVLGAPHGFINLLSVHEGIHRETKHIISEFDKFVKGLLNA